MQEKDVEHLISVGLVLHIKQPLIKFMAGNIVWTSLCLFKINLYSFGFLKGTDERKGKNTSQSYQQKTATILLIQYNECQTSR